MNVINIHQRSLKQPIAKVAELLQTLASKEDRVWPYEQWPAMRFKDGIRVGAHGGHGPIRYTVERYDPNAIIQFRFSRPMGFQGIHKLELSELNQTTTEIKHSIEMQTSGWATLVWVLAIRWLHDALVEDAFDKVEDQLRCMPKKKEWNWWVRFLREGWRTVQLSKDKF